MPASVVKKIYNINDIPITTVKNFFDNLNASLISTSLSGQILTITVDNLITIEYNKENSSSRRFTLTVFDENGSRIAYAGFNTTSSYVPPYTFLACYSDNIFYHQYNDSYNRRLVFVYEIIEGKHYFGATGSSDSSGQPWYPITSVSLKQVENQSNYAHIKILNYTAPLNYIDYSSDVLFENGNTMSNYIDTNTITCTTVTQDNVITFGAHNYYSLGPNTLIQLKGGN